MSYLDRSHSEPYLREERTASGEPHDMYQDSRSFCDWPLTLSAGQREKEEEGRGERRREFERVKGEQANLGGWEEALYPLGMWRTLAGCCWVLDTASISL